MNCILFEDEYPYKYRAYSQYTNGYKDWNNIETIGQIKIFGTIKYYFLKHQKKNHYLIKWDIC